MWRPFLVVGTFPVADYKAIVVHFQGFTDYWMFAIVFKFDCHKIAFLKQINIYVFLHILCSPGRVSIGASVNLSKKSNKKFDLSILIYWFLKLLPIIIFFIHPKSVSNNYNIFQCHSSGK